MFSNHTAPYFNMITYLPSTHAVAALLSCQTAPFSLSPPQLLTGSCFFGSLHICLSPALTSPKLQARSSLHLCITGSFHQCQVSVSSWCQISAQPTKPTPFLGSCIGGRKTLLCSRLCKEHLQGSSSTGLSWRAASPLVLITQGRSLPPLFY